MENYFEDFFVFLFKISPKTAELIQMTFLYSCFLQKFGLYFFDAEPVGTLNETSTSVYLSNTIKLGKSSPVHI